jgi:hypothetical protein
VKRGFEGAACRRDRAPAAQKVTQKAIPKAGITLLPPMQRLLDTAFYFALGGST